MKKTIWLAILASAACTSSQVSVPTPPAGAAPVGAQQAYFMDFPATLFATLVESCDRPGETVSTPSDEAVLCSALPDPESAAALILQFDGTVEELPTFVISLAGRDTDDGYLVTADNYIRVPQRDGGVRQVRFDDAETATSLERLLSAAGGAPL